MNAASATIENPSSIAPEEQARADLYAVLAALFYRPPDVALLKAIASAARLATTNEESPLADGWRALQRTAAVANREAAWVEYDS